MTIDVTRVEVYSKLFVGPIMTKIVASDYNTIHSAYINLYIVIKNNV